MLRTLPYPLAFAVVTEFLLMTAAAAAAMTSTKMPDFFFLQTVVLLFRVLARVIAKAAEVSVSTTYFMRLLILRAGPSALMPL